MKSHYPFLRTLAFVGRVGLSQLQPEIAIESVQFVLEQLSFAKVIDCRRTTALEALLSRSKLAPADFGFRGATNADIQNPIGVGSSRTKKLKVQATDFLPGSLVEIHSLRSAPEHNSKHGKVVRYDHGRGRYVVEVMASAAVGNSRTVESTGEKLALKAVNLRSRS
eukprot:SAG31_NODE_1702_length_7496_cov_2.367311_11_plen_166_part_00